MLAEPSPRQLEDALVRRGAGASPAEATGIIPAAQELEAMLAVADRLVGLEGGEPDPAIRERIREDFVREGTGHRAAWVHQHRMPVRRARHPLPSHGFRWTLVVTVALVLALVAGVSLALAAQLAEPDSSLYPLKLRTESVLLAVNRTPVSQASVRLQLANQRFRDAEAMAAKGEGGYAGDAMAAYYDQLRAAGNLLAGARHDGSWKSVRDQFDTLEAKQPDLVVNQLQASHQDAAVARINALAAQFGKDRKTIDARLNPAPASGGGTPQPLPSGALGQPGAPTP